MLAIRPVFAGLAHTEKCVRNFRVHQFDKVEMFSFCSPEESWNELEMLREIEQEILNELGLPHRVILVASGDLGVLLH